MYIFFLLFFCFIYRKMFIGGLSWQTSPGKQMNSNNNIIILVHWCTFFFLLLLLLEFQSHTVLVFLPHKFVCLHRQYHVYTCGALATANLWHYENKKCSHFFVFRWETTQEHRNCTKRTIQTVYGGCGEKIEIELK